MCKRAGREHMVKAGGLCVFSMWSWAGKGMECGHLGIPFLTGLFWPDGWNGLVVVKGRFHCLKKVQSEIRTFGFRAWIKCSCLLVLTVGVYSWARGLADRWSGLRFCFWVSWIFAVFIKSQFGTVGLSVSHSMGGLLSWFLDTSMWQNVLLQFVFHGGGNYIYKSAGEGRGRRFF